MRFDVVTLFPEQITAALGHSIIGRALAANQIQLVTHNLRDFAADGRGTVDDTPYGGGSGMVLKVDVVDACLQHVKKDVEEAGLSPYTILLTAQGPRFTQRIAERFSRRDQITLICGHYEGFDHRISQLVDTELSIGDFVLTGGELAAAMVIDAVSRLRPGVIEEGSIKEESFSLCDESGQPLLEYPHYTRPAEYKGMQVPEILLSGNHAKIAEWRLAMAKERTQTEHQEP